MSSEDIFKFYLLLILSPALPTSWGLTNIYIEGSGNIGLSSTPQLQVKAQRLMP